MCNSIYYGTVYTGTCNFVCKKTCTKFNLYVCVLRFCFVGWWGLSCLRFVIVSCLRPLSCAVAVAVAVASPVHSYQ